MWAFSVRSWVNNTPILFPLLICLFTTLLTYRILCPLSCPIASLTLFSVYYVPIAILCDCSLIGLYLCFVSLLWFVYQLAFIFPADILKFWLLVNSRKILFFGFYPQLVPFYSLFFVLYCGWSMLLLFLFPAFIFKF